MEADRHQYQDRQIVVNLKKRTRPGVLSGLCITHMKSNKNRNFVLAIALAIAAATVGCGGTAQKPATAPMTPYVGSWTSPDDTTFVIREDGTCDYRSESETITNAKINLDPAQRAVNFNDPPKLRKIELDTSVNQLILDGVVFRKTPGIVQESKGSEGR